jgi:hypothetical protein
MKFDLKCIIFYLLANIVNMRSKIIFSFKKFRIRRADGFYPLNASFGQLSYLYKKEKKSAIFWLNARNISAQTL